MASKSSERVIIPISDPRFVYCVLAGSLQIAWAN
ncbi:hypothetical protein CCACVL1_05961 [Corchorus capsularis]|uniref:Uncharacterized protein n=1 Tax=Corchorus capsularis TaxID=210143 RepID=A0A1R3JI97_COCAP|nr:hypothetical protein CCACVL1_05961 [Corchorus capsularis]